VLPTEFAGMSLLTAGVSDSPPGPAIALYRQGALGTRLGTSQVVTIGVDGRTYRRLDLAERRGIDGADGEWHHADALLAPDGASVAVADPQRVRDQIEVVDLRTGRSAGYRLDRAAAVHMLDWSPDGRRLAFTAYDTPMDGTERPGRLAVLDTGTGAVTRLGDLAMRRGTASFSPDGDRIAIVHTALTASARSVSIVDMAGTVLWTLPDRAPTQVTWSPDGTLLAATYVRPDGWQLVFVDPTGRNGSTPAPIEFPGGTGADQVVGWRSTSTVLVRAGAGSAEIIEVPVAGGPRHRLSRIPDGVAGLGRPGQVQLAEALITDAQVRDRDVERGPWPTWWRLTLAATALFVGAAVVRFGGIRRTGRAR
jgi:dipeptidyl aminopeptidase/acylaminoacyl peptidase